MSWEFWFGLATLTVSAFAVGHSVHTRRRAEIATFNAAGRSALKECDDLVTICGFRAQRVIGALAFGVPRERLARFGDEFEDAYANAQAKVASTFGLLRRSRPTAISDRLMSVRLNLDASHTALVAEFNSQSTPARALEVKCQELSAYWERLHDALNRLNREAIDELPLAGVEHLRSRGAA